MTVTRIDGDADRIGGRNVVAPSQLPQDLPGLRVVTDDSNVQVVVVVQDADFRPLARWRSFLRILLNELVEDERGQPLWLSQLAVDGRGRADANRPNELGSARTFDRSESGRRNAQKGNGDPTPADIGHPSSRINRGKRMLV